MKHKDSIPETAQGGSWARRFVREPLVHFLLFGGLLFGAWYALNDEPQISDANRIVIDEAQMASIAATFRRTSPAVRAGTAVPGG